MHNSTVLLIESSVVFVAHSHLNSAGLNAFFKVLLLLVLKSNIRLLLRLHVCPRFYRVRIKGNLRHVDFHALGNFLAKFVFVGVKHCGKLASHCLTR